MLFLHELFVTAANKYPDKYAVVWDTSLRTYAITYDQLLNESGVVVNELISAGVDCEYIGIPVDSSVSYPAVAIGILRSNCAYVSLDLQNTSAFKMQLMENLNIRFVFTNCYQGLAEKWKTLKELHIHNETVYLMSRIEVPHKMLPKGSDFTMAYAIHTSGTTGIPKIIQVPHESIVPNILQLRNLFGVGPDDTVFLSSSLTFDPSVVETFIALTSGASLLVAPHHVRAAPGTHLFRFLFERSRECCGRVSILSVTPSYAACLLSISSDSVNVPERICPCLKVLSLGGEPCPPTSLLHEWKNKLGGATKIFSLYGITEVSCWASIAEIELDDKNVDRAVARQSASVFYHISSSTCVETVTSEKNKFEVESSSGNPEICVAVNESKTLLNKPISFQHSNNAQMSEIHRNDELSRRIKSIEMLNEISIGSPMMQTYMEVRDSLGNIVTSGEGELYVGSDTRVCLLDNENVGLIEKGKVVFRATGDRVKVHYRNTSSEETSPSIYYIGRMDGAVKRFGKWILTKSVETLATEFVWEYENMEQLSIEASCCVWCSKNSERGKLGLFVVPSCKKMFEESKPMKQNFVADLMSRLFEALPSNSWPDLIIPIEKLPLTTHGKVDRVKLIGIMKNLMVTKVTKSICNDSNSDDEPIIQLKKLWMRYLNLSGEPSSNDNFLMSGGDSLLALRLISELEESLDCSVPPLLLTTLLKGTYGEACSCINLQCDILGYDRGMINTTSTSEKRTQFEEVIPFEKKFKSSESDLDVPKIERMNYNDQLCIMYRRGLIIKYNSTAKLAPMFLASDNSVTFIHGWKYDLGKCVDASPVLLQYNRLTSIVVVGSHSHQLVAVHAETGVKISSCELPDRIESSACSSMCGKFIFVGCYDYSMYCINIQSGQIIWSYRTGNMIKSSPVIVKDGSAVLFGSYDEFLYCVELQKGELIWKIKPGKGSIYSSPCLCQKNCSIVSSLEMYRMGKTSDLAEICPTIILIATLGGSCAAVLESDGRILWSHEIQVPIFATPMNFGDKALFSSVKGEVICFSVKSGDKVWSFQAGGNVFSSFSLLEAEDEKLVVFGCHDHSLYCLNCKGELKWCTQLDSPVFAIPFIFPLQFTSSVKNKQSEDGNRTDWVAATSTKGGIYLIDVYFGSIKARMKISNEIFSSPIAYKNSVIFGCRDNSLYCIRVI